MDIIPAQNDDFIDNLSDKSIIVSKSYRNRTIIGIEIDRESDEFLSAGNQKRVGIDGLDWIITSCRDFVD